MYSQVRQSSMLAFSLCPALCHLCPFLCYHILYTSWVRNIHTKLYIVVWVSAREVKLFLAPEAVPWMIYLGRLATESGILYLVMLNKADFSTQVLSVVFPHIPPGPRSKVKPHTERCHLVFIPFGRISTFFRLLYVPHYMSPFQPSWPRFSFWLTVVLLG